MPGYGVLIAEAVARKQAIKWYTGCLAKPFLPWSFDQSSGQPDGFSQPGKNREILNVASKRPGAQQVLQVARFVRQVGSA